MGKFYSIKEIVNVTIYIILLIVVLLCCFLESNTVTLKIGNNRIKTRNVSFIICFLFIFIMGIFRAELLGVDVNNYKEYFEVWYLDYTFIDTLKNINIDIGYVLINKIIYLFTHDFFVAKCIIYSVSFGLISYVIYKRSMYPALSYLIYIGFGYLGLSFCILRQFLAIPICLYAYKFVEKRDLKKFIIAIAIASTFHKTAITFLIIYPLLTYQFKNYQFVKKIVMISVFFIGALIILPILMSVYVNDYSDNFVVGEGISLLLFFVFINIFLSLFSQYFKKTIVTKKQKDILFLPICFQIIAFFFSLFSRITYYFSILFIITIPNIVYKNKNNKIIVVVFIVIFSLLFAYNLITDSSNIIPYSSIFD